KAFDQIVDAYQKGNLPLSAYLEKLSTDSLPPLNVELFLEAHALESKINFAQADHERDAVLQRLVSKLDEQQTAKLTQLSVALRSNEIKTTDFYFYLTSLCKSAQVDLKQFPAFDDYIRYILLSDSINGETLFKEARTLETRRYGELVK